MIENILVLLIANIFLPLLPMPPQLAAPLPLLQLCNQQPSAYEYLNLPRLHSQEELKKKYREAIKVLHPDHGGSQESFAFVQDMKDIMTNEDTKYLYDTLNITSYDLVSFKIEEISSLKEMNYFVEAGIYYFLALLYALAFTIDEHLRPSRKFIIPLILLSAGYEYILHFYPKYPTPIDFLNTKIPIFTQKTILKTTLSILIAMIRTIYDRRQTQQKVQLFQLDKENTTKEQYLVIVEKLKNCYHERAKNKAEAASGWSSKIRGWISKLFTLFIIYSVVSGFFEGGNDSKYDL